LKFRLSNTFFVVSIAAVFVALFVVASIFAFLEYKQFNEQMSMMETSILNEKKLYIRQELESTKKMFDYNHAQRLKKLDDEIKSRVDEACATLDIIYNKHKATKSKKEILDIMKESLRNQRFFDGFGYYALFDLEGTTILSPLKPELEGTKELLDFKDLKNQYPMRYMIENVKPNKGIYFQWTFFNPKDLDSQELKRGYAKIFEPYNLVILTAQYLHIIEEELKSEALNRIENSQSLTKYETFVYDKNKESFLFNKLTCKEKIVDSIIQKQENLPTDSVAYFDFTCDDINMIFAAKKYKNWDWIIGTSINNDDFMYLMSEKKDILQEKIRFRLEIVVVILLILGVIFFLLSLKLKKTILSNIDVFVEFFQQAQDKNVFIDKSKLNFYEFELIAKFANLMMKQKIENTEEICSQKTKLDKNNLILSQYKQIIDAGLIVSKTDSKGTITYINDEFCKISGYTKEELLGKNHNKVRHPDMPTSTFEDLWQTIKAKKIWKGVIKNRKKSGEEYYVNSVVAPVLDLDGEVEEYIAVRSDVTDLINQEKRLQAKVTDKLTGLPNRQKLLEDLEIDFEHKKIAIFDVVGFKEINEHFGFEVGDELLLKIKENIQSVIAKHSSVKLYRLMGDEFVILSNICKKEQFLKVCSEILDVFEEKILLGNEAFKLDMACGVSFQKNYFINAEMALNHAKKEKKRVIVFDDNTNIKKQLEQNIHMIQNLREALEEDRIVVFQQPIISKEHANINRYECLVRLVNRDGTILSPFSFLDLAKKAKLYHQITKTVIEKSFEHFKHGNDSFSINLTIEDILSNETVTMLFRKMEQNIQLFEKVTLEIVEDEGIENFDEVNSFITRAKSKGFKIAIDDFGTGYSNFEYLMKLQVDYIKIDGSLIRNLHIDRNSQIVTELIVSFAKRLGIKTVAEFVHSEEVLESVKKMDIDYFQGYHLGEPKQLDKEV
jgi:PAS domain S-box-containing protein/diguanylate cyclase (GGDEF)-like protein